MHLLGVVSWVRTAICPPFEDLGSLTTIQEIGWDGVRSLVDFGHWDDADSRVDHVEQHCEDTICFSMNTFEEINSGLTREAIRIWFVDALKPGPP